MSRKSYSSKLVLLSKLRKTIQQGRFPWRSSRHVFDYGALHSERAKFTNAVSG